MTTDWKKWSTAEDLRARDQIIEVTFSDGRNQKVYVEEGPGSDSFRLWSVAAPPSVVARFHDPDLYTWERNPGSDLVGFKIDRRGRLIGELHLPLPGLDKSEWQVCVRLLAQRCDRLEFLLTGRDVN